MTTRHSALAEPDETELAGLDAWWRAANYLTIGQIYLRGNPLLREPLAPEHIKPRLLGHWGTSAGLSLIYAVLAAAATLLLAARRGPVATLMSAAAIGVVVVLAGGELPH